MISGKSHWRRYFYKSEPSGTTINIIELWLITTLYYKPETDQIIDTKYIEINLASPKKNLFTNIPNVSISLIDPTVIWIFFNWCCYEFWRLFCMQGFTLYFQIFIRWLIGDIGTLWLSTISTSSKCDCSLE